MNVKLITAPLVTCVSVTEAKEQIRVLSSAEDTIVGAYIVAAEKLAESVTGRKFISQTWEYYLPHFPCSRFIILPFPPLKAFTSLKYYDAGNVLQTLVKDTDYIVDDIAEIPVIHCMGNKSWPSVYPFRPVNNIIAKFDCGYGDTGSTVPEPIRRAVIQIAGYLYEHREEELLGSDVIPFISNWLLTPYKTFNTPI